MKPIISGMGRYDVSNRHLHHIRLLATTLATAAVLITTVGLTGCKDLTGSQQLPSGTTDPKFYNNKQGALLERNSAMLSFFGALSAYVVESGLLTDELQDVNTNAGQGTILANGNTIQDPLDERFLSSSSSGSSLDGSQSYGLLQGTRGFTSQAIGMLATYDTAVADLSSQKIMRAELYALTGYSEIMLADLFCSGVPLSTLDFQRDFTYHAGSNTVDVYRAAKAQFDTALMLADTSTQIANLARVGLGRAYLDRGLYDSAANAVQSVPDGFSYQISHNFVNAEFGGLWFNGCPDLGNTIGGPTGLTCTARMSDQEGGNGVAFLSSGDPRTLDTAIYQNKNSGDSIYFPLKYRLMLNTSTLALTVANGVEARLIEAEGAFHSGGDWLAILEALHSTLPGVTPLTDPGLSSSNPDSARVALIFRERAEWLYLTGLRQGDLRRQLRQYNQYFTSNPSRVYPSGVYTAPGIGKYGPDVNVQIPQSEFVNPLFQGCLSRDP